MEPESAAPSAAIVAPDHLPPRRRLLRLRRILADLVHPSVSLVDRRSAAVPVYPSRAAAFLRSGRLFVVAVDLGGAGAPPPAGRAAVAAFGRTERLPRGARPSAAGALGCG
uniref:Transposon protein, putative, CACTA, En/Spm sub-class n=1 Tax=Oryza sativa subsp. japonica TaxID=39947 RepID=Q84SS9_ORYSJ|nr:transposon protein, putative, CACTA, En/Spm sub-class [Oryza sativa Japonica Group]